MFLYLCILTPSYSQVGVQKNYMFLNHIALQHEDGVGKQSSGWEKLSVVHVVLAGVHPGKTLGGGGRNKNKVEFNLDDQRFSCWSALR